MQIGMAPAKTSDVCDAFSAALNALGPFEARPHLAVAVSGGSDSMALCLLADAWARERNGRITALTVDHGLRAESREEALWVEQQLRARATACVRFHLTLEHKGNLQQQAREARYAAMLDWCRQHHVLHLLIGHHASDQAETHVLHEARGTTADGASAMASCSLRGGVRILRPMLALHKSELENFLRVHHQPWLEDPSNASHRFARNRLRGTLDVAARSAQARDAGKQRHVRDQQLVQDAAHTLCIYAEGYAQIDRARYLALPDSNAAALLSATLRTLAGKTTRPRHHETLGAHAVIREGALTRITRMHCVIHVKADTVLIVRETARMGTFEITSAQGEAYYAGFWRVRWQGLKGSGYRLAPLGKMGARALKTFAPNGLPQAIFPSLVALWHLDQVVCVPHIAWRHHALPQHAKLQLSAAAPVALAASPFWYEGMNHAQPLT